MFLGDNVKDIDWKASARSGSLLIKQFIAEKKHNIILVFDSNKKMLGNSKGEVTKKELQILSLGTIAYLANKNGDYVAGLYNSDSLMHYSSFKSTLVGLEQILASYDVDPLLNSPKENLNKSLEYIIKHINRKAIVFIATDIYGLSNVSEQLLRTLAVNNNVLFINIEDAELSGSKVLDLEENELMPKMLLNNKELIAINADLKDNLKKKALEKLKKYAMPIVDISDEKEVVPKIIELLEKHKYGK
jgi:uncharacterized protein (DUF58 family)